MGSPVSGTALTHVVPEVSALWMRLSTVIIATRATWPDVAYDALASP
ncbi:hypothetical protein [Streptomyces hokutonensis]